MLLEGWSSLLIYALLWPSLFLYFIGLHLPVSETAAGGNYNLRFLSPQARQAISPFPFPDTDSSGFAVSYDKLYTLYMPGAGFLWSDDMIWEQRLPERLRYKANTHNEDDQDSPWSTDGSYRTYFDDKFVQRYPWVIKPLKKRGVERPEGVVQSQSRVKLYDPSAGQYLCMLPDDKVATEAVYFEVDADSKDKPEDRFRIG